MRLKQSKKLSEIADILNCQFKGSENIKITGINEIHVVEHGDIVFVDHPKYYKKALESEATTILINKDVECPAGKALLISEQPFEDFNILIKHFTPTPGWNKQNQPVKTDEGSDIHNSVSIGNNVSIGKRVKIYPGVVIYDNVTIKDDTIIHANAVIGGDAFYYKKTESGYKKLTTCGSVYIEKEVEIGAGATIDRGVTGVTTISEGTKIDNKVHIGHDVFVGKNCLFAADVGIAGCVRIEDEVTLWGQVGVVSDLTIGKGSVVLGQAGISKDLAPYKTYFGSPAGDARLKYREMAAIRKLPDLIEQL